MAIFQTNTAKEAGDHRMRQVIESIRDHAMHVLLDEAFGHIRMEMQEGYAMLAKKNSKIVNIPHAHFMCDGGIYPSAKEGVSMMPALHYSLHDEFTGILNKVKYAGFSNIKNYFAEVLSKSENGIVLDRLLPAILVNKLQQVLGTEHFGYLNQGTVQYISNKHSDADITRANIKTIENNYADTISLLRELLMENVLLG